MAKQGQADCHHQPIHSDPSPGHVPIHPDPRLAMADNLPAGWRMKEHHYLPQESLLPADWSGAGQ